MSPLILAIVIPLAFFGLFALINKFLNPIIARRKFEKWSKNRLKNNQKTDPRVLEKAEYGTLKPDEVFLRAKIQKGEAVTFAWTEVEEIRAFKRDLFTTDLICLAFILSDNRAIEIHEEMVGYCDLQPWLQKKFPQIPEDWFMDVAFPAFATNHRVIWRKTNSTSNIFCL